MSNSKNLENELLKLEFGPGDSIAESIIRPDNTCEQTYFIKLNISHEILDLLVFKLSITDERIDEMKVTLTRFMDLEDSNIVIWEDIYESNKASLPTKQEIVKKARELVHLFEIREKFFLNKLQVNSKTHQKKKGR